ncbi:AraC family transcriptional regulator, partial [Eisenbergiella tayi]
EVAELCGFSDAFYFSKVYREQKGISPSKVSRFHDNR